MIFDFFQMTNTVETDLTKKLETSSLEAAKNEIPIAKDAADLIKAQANEAFKSKNNFSLFVFDLQRNEYS